VFCGVAKLQCRQLLTFGGFVACALYHDSTISVSIVNSELYFLYLWKDLDVQKKTEDLDSDRIADRVYYNLCFAAGLVGGSPRR
jgi:hypothetical protein